MSTFSAQINSFVKKTNAKMDLVHKAVVVKVYRGVVLRTPVDTGRARASWLIGPNGEIPSSFLPPVPKGSPPLPPDFAQLGNLSGAGTVTNIVNNVPYIVRLEEGWSQLKAPQGMMRVTVNDVKAQFAAIVRGLQ